MQTDTLKPSAIPDTASPASIDPRDFRRALGAFATGVTIVTTLDGDGTPLGFTANSFTSVSLDPPLVLVCLAKGAGGYGVFSETSRFAVNILAEDQRTQANIFATAGADKFASVRWRSESSGAPVFADVAAWVDCEVHAHHDGGDHLILIGKVVAYAHSPRPPLGYCRGTYINLALTTAALDTAANDGPVRIGAIVERDGCVLFRTNPETDALELPAARRMGQPGDGLLALLAGAGITARPDFVYAVFEDTGVQAVYYRAVATECGKPTDPTFVFRPLNDATLARVANAAVQSMLNRYRAESARDLFGVYVGTHEKGDVRPLGKGDQR